MSSCNDLTKPKFNTPLCKPHPCIAQSRENIISPLIPNYKIQQQHSHPPPPLTRPRSASASPFYQPNRNPTPGPRLCHPQTPQTLVISPYYIRPKKKRAAASSPLQDGPRSPSEIETRSRRHTLHPARPTPARPEPTSPPPNPPPSKQRKSRKKARRWVSKTKFAGVDMSVPSRPVPSRPRLA